MTVSMSPDAMSALSCSTVSCGGAGHRRSPCRVSRSVIRAARAAGRPWRRSAPPWRPGPASASPPRIAATTASCWSLECAMLRGSTGIADEQLVQGGLGAGHGLDEHRRAGQGRDGEVEAAVGEPVGGVVGRLAGRLGALHAARPAGRRPGRGWRRARPRRARRRGGSRGRRRAPHRCARARRRRAAGLQPGIGDDACRRRVRAGS